MIQITNIRKNIMGTASFDMMIKGWRKPQNFSVYPIHSESSPKGIIIQSEKRFGRINLEFNFMVLSKNHNNSCSIHLQMDIANGQAEHHDVKNGELKELIEFVVGTASAKAGTKGTGVFTDNSGAINLTSL